MIAGAMGYFNLWQATTTGQQWYDTLDAFALSVLDEKLDYNRIVSALSSITLPDFFSYCHYQQQTLPKDLKSTLGLSANDDANASDLSQALFNLLIQQHYASPCLWWTKGSDHVAACMRISEGLPDTGQFAALLDGQWQQWGWHEADALIIAPESR